MPNVNVLDMSGKNVGTMDLSDAIFGIEPNTAVMHKMVEEEGKVSGRTAFNAMKAGDKLGKEVVDEYLLYLAEGITNMVNMAKRASTADTVITVIMVIMEKVKIRKNIRIVSSEEKKLVRE